MVDPTPHDIIWLFLPKCDHLFTGDIMSWLPQGFEDCGLNMVPGSHWAGTCSQNNEILGDYLGIIGKVPYPKFGRGVLYGSPETEVVKLRGTEKG